MKRFYPFPKIGTATGTGVVFKRKRLALRFYNVVLSYQHGSPTASSFEGESNFAAGDLSEFVGVVSFCTGISSSLLQ